MKGSAIQRSIKKLSQGVLSALFILGVVGNARGMIDSNSEPIHFFLEPLPDVLCRSVPGSGKELKYVPLELDYSKIFYAKIQILEQPIRAPEVSDVVRKVRIQVLEVLKGTVPTLEGQSADEFYLHWGTGNPSVPLRIRLYSWEPGNPDPLVTPGYILGMERNGKIFSKGLFMSQFRYSKLGACIQKGPSWIPNWLLEWWAE